jgi:aromatic ring-opening dioxygenase catalytic subunit (LigB family)
MNKRSAWRTDEMTNSAAVIDIPQGGGPLPLLNRKGHEGAVGFSHAAYEIRYPASGSPELARQTLDQLPLSGIKPRTDGKRGFAPHARTCHPREEHLLPLMVCSETAGYERADVLFDNAIMGRRALAFLWRKGW